MKILSGKNVNTKSVDIQKTIVSDIKDFEDAEIIFNSLGKDLFYCGPMGTVKR